MSTQVGAVSVGVIADVSQYLQQMVQVGRTTRNAMEEMLELAKAEAAQRESAAAAAKEEGKLASSMREASTAAKSHGLSLADLAGGYSLAKEAATALASAAGEVINAANDLNPKGALAYGNAVVALQDNVRAAAASLGEALRPAIMWVVQSASEFAKVVARIDWDKVKREGLNFVGGLKEALDDAASWVKSTLYDVAVGAARALAFPFQVLQEAIAAALSGAFSLASGTFEKIARLIDAVGLGDKVKELTGFDAGAVAKSLAAASEAAKKEASKLDIGKQLVDGSMEAIGTAGRYYGKALVDAGKGAIGELAGNVKDFWGGMLKKDTGKPPPHATNAGDEAATSAERALVQFNAGFDQMVNKLSAGAQQAAEILNKAADQEMAKRAAIAQTAVENAEEALQKAYGESNTKKVEAARQALALAIEELERRQDAAMEEKRNQIEAAHEIAAQRKDEASNLMAAALEAKNTYAAATKNFEAFAKANQLNTGPGKDAKQAMENAKSAAETSKAGAEQAAEIAKQAAATEGKIRVEYAELAGKQTVEAGKRTAKELRDAADYAARTSFIRLGSDLAKQTLTGAGGTLGNVAQGAFSGFEQTGGDPIGGLIGAIVGLLTKSKGFSELIDSVNEILDGLGTAVGKLLEGVTPLTRTLAQALTPLLNGLGEALGGVAQGLVASVMPAMPGIYQLAVAVGELLHAVTPVIPPLLLLSDNLSLLTPAAALVTAVASPLALGLEYVAEGLNFVTQGIGGFWNQAIDAFQKMLQELGQIPVVGSTLTTLAGSLDSWKVHLDASAVAMESVVPASEHVRSAFQELAQQAYSQLHNAQDAALKSDALSAAATKAEAAAAANPNDPVLQAYAEAVRKAADDASKQAVAAMDQYRVDQAEANLSQYAPGTQDYNNAMGALSAALAQQAYDAAQNTNATKDNTKATKDLSGILNAPQGFKLEGYQYAAIGARSALDAGAVAQAPTRIGGRAPAGGINVGVINISLPNVTKPEDFADELSKAMQKLTFRRTGTMAPSLPGGRFSTSGQS